MNLKTLPGVLRLTAAAAVPATLPLLVSPSLYGNPSAPTIVAGDVSFVSEGGQLFVKQGSSRAIVNWQDFSIGLGESVRFLQPDALSATLNRVIGSGPSSLLGELSANGRVFLINPNGVLIGAGARVDTAGFVASTLDTSNADFMANKDLVFVGDSAASIRNLGTLDASEGDIFLIARNIENAGKIKAANGTAGMAVGSEVLLTTGGAERVFVRTGATGASIENSGLVEAAEAELKAAGGNVYALAINNSGTVRATGTETRDGQLWLVADGGVKSSGTLSASSADQARGGEIRLLGNSVELASGSLVDASGSEQGGTVLVGGDYQGKNATLSNAKTTTVASGASIVADGASKGGRVIVWSDENTVFAGSISAQGATGGFVETSGKTLSLTGTVKAGGSGAGTAGTWLIDPADVTIDSTVAASLATALSNGTSTSVDATNSITVASSLYLQLGAGGVTRNPTLTFNSGGTISFNSGIELMNYFNAGDTSASSLNFVLNAAANIDFNNLNLWSGGNAINVSATSTSGQIAFGPSSALRTAGGTITLTAGNAIRLDGLGGTGSGFYTNGGAITANSGTGRLYAVGYSLNSNGADIQLNTGASGTGYTLLDATYLSTTGGSVSIGAASPVTGASVTLMGGSAIQTGSGNISIQGAANGSSLSAMNRAGVSLLGGSLLQTSGNIELTGTGMAGANGVYGVLVDASTITDGSSITLRGQGEGADSAGVQINHGSTILGAGGTLTLDGRSSASASAQDYVIGVDIYGSLVKNTAGSVSIKGDATPSMVAPVTGFQNHGVLIDLNSEIYATKTISIEGVGGGRGDVTPGATQRNGNYGVVLYGSVTSAGAEDIVITGFGGSSDYAGEDRNDGNVGVSLSSATVTALGTGGISITGTGGSSPLAGYNHGVLFNTLSGQSRITTVQTSGGDIDITAHGQGMEGAGFVLRDGAQVKATGAGSLTIDADTKSGATQGYTIAGRFSNGLIQTENGLLSITGTNLSTASVAATDTWAVGVSLLANATVRTTGTGDISITGTGGSISSVSHNNGVVIAGLVETQNGGDISITGTSGPAASTGGFDGMSQGVYIGTDGNWIGYTPGAGLATVQALNGGAVSITGTSNAVSSTANAVLVDTAGAIKGAGAATVSVAGTGNVSVANLSTSNQTLSVAASGNLSLNGNLSSGTSGRLVLTPGTAMSVSQLSGSIIAGTLDLQGTNAVHSLEGSSNQVGYLTANTGTISFFGDGGFAIGTSATPSLNGITATGRVNLVALGASSDLFLNSFINVAAGSNTEIKLTATRDVIVNQGSSISASGAHKVDVTLTSDSANRAGGGSVYLLQGSSIFTNNGALSIGGGNPDGYAVARSDNPDLPYGVWIATSTVNTGTGSITVKGYGGDNGVRLNGASLTTTSGDIQIDGVASSAGGTGVFAKSYVNSSGPTTPTVITTGSGTIQIYGTGNTTGSATSGQDLWTGVNLWTDDRDLTESNSFDAKGVYLASTSGRISLQSGNAGIRVGSLAGLRTNGTGVIVFNSTGVVDMAGSLASTSGPIAILADDSISLSGKISTPSGIVYLQQDSSGSVTQQAGSSITAGALALNGTNATFSLTSTTNAIAKLAARTGTLQLATGGALEIGSIEVDGVTFEGVTTTLGDLSIAADSLTVNQAVDAGAHSALLRARAGDLTIGSTGSVTATGSGSSPIVLTTTGSFRNNAGLSALNAGSGRFLIYSVKPEQNTLGGLTGVGVYRKSYDSYAPASVTESGNVFLYSYAPTLTITPDNASRLFGADNPTFTYSITGFLPGDSLTEVVSGTPTFTTTASKDSPMGSYTITASLGSLTSSKGYDFAFGSSTLTISGALLSIAANDMAKTYGQANPTFTATYSGFVGNDTSTVVTGLQFSTSATTGSNVGKYTITPFGATTPSYYVVSYIPGTLTINPAALTITANDASRIYGAANPTFSATFTGLVNGDTQSTVAPGLQLTTSATSGANVGQYEIKASGGTVSPNYSVTFVSGTLSVTPASLYVSVGDVSREYGQANPAFSFLFNGLTNGDTSAVVSGLQVKTDAGANSQAGTYTLTPYGGKAANYVLSYTDGHLTVLAPTVDVGGVPYVVVSTGGTTLLDSNYAVVDIGGALQLGTTSGSFLPVQQATTTLFSPPYAPQVAPTLLPPLIGQIFSLSGAPTAPSASTPVQPPAGDSNGFILRNTVPAVGFSVVYEEPVAAGQTTAVATSVASSSYRDFDASANVLTTLQPSASGGATPANPTKGGNE